MTFFRPQIGLIFFNFESFSINLNNTSALYKGKIICVSVPIVSRTRYHYSKSPLFKGFFYTPMPITTYLPLKILRFTVF